MKVKKHSQREINKIFTFAVLLRLLLEGKTQTDISKTLNWSKQRTNYWIKQLEKEGLIQQELRAKIKTYSITPKGKKFLTWSKDTPKWEVFLHRVGLKFPIIESTSKFDGLDWKDVALKNWIKKVLKYQHIDGEFSIERNPNNLIIWCQEYVGNNPYKLFYEAIKDNLLFADNLETRYKVKLGIPQLYRKPHFGINEPIIARINEYIQVTGIEEWIDTTPFPGSTEFFDPLRVIQYLRMPNKIETCERRLQEITEQMKIFGEGMREHMKLISFLQELTVSLNKVANSLPNTTQLKDE